MIDATCVNCGAAVQFHDSAVGDFKRCPKCKGMFVVMPTATGTGQPKSDEPGAGESKKPKQRQEPAD